MEGRDEGEGEVVLLRTALNGRPRAGVNWGKNGVENLGRERFSTPDGPKWTAQREGGGGEYMNGHLIPGNTPDGPKWTARSVGSRWSSGWGRGENRTLQTVLNGVIAKELCLLET